MNDGAGPFGAGFNVARSDPAADAVLFELRADGVCGRFIVMRVADEDVVEHGLAIRKSAGGAILSLEVGGMVIIAKRVRSGRFVGAVNFSGRIFCFVLGGVFFRVNFDSLFF